MTVFVQCSTFTELELNTSIRNRKNQKERVIFANPSIRIRSNQKERVISKSKELEGFTRKLEGFTQSNLLLDIETIRRKESTPFKVSLEIHFKINSTFAASLKNHNFTLKTKFSKQIFFVNNL